MVLLDSLHVAVDELLHVLDEIENVAFLDERTQFRAQYERLEKLERRSVQQNVSRNVQN